MLPLEEDIMRSRFSVGFFLAAVLLAISSITAPLNAATITFTAGGANPTNINALSPLPEIMLDNTGVGSVVYLNNTELEFTDFSFRANVLQTADLDGNGGTFFDRTTLANRQRITFLKGNTGNGIAAGETFTVNFSGFTAGAKVVGQPSAVPEPGTMLLSVSAFVGLALFRRRMNRSSGV